MITYASYIGDDENLGVDGVSIAAFNTFVGVLAGLVVFPLLFTQGVEVGDAGAGAVFVSVANALAGLPAGRVLGVVFFGVVLIAALSSAISLLEVVTAYVVDNYRFGRVQTATGIGALLFLTGLPSALDTAWLEWADNVGASLLLPLAALGVVFFVGWIMTEDALDEVRQGTDGAETLSVLWLWSLRTVVLAAVGLTVGLSLLELSAPPL
jgi:NSS family neurotransmitter:Na+ symporter